MAAVGAPAGTNMYVYGVTRAGARPSGRGVADAAVATVDHGKLAAIVSALPTARVKAKRRDLLRHSDVLQETLVHAPVAPFRFGTVFESTEAVVEEFLDPRYDELVSLLDRIDGLVELRLRARFVERELLAEIVRDDPRIAGLREATRSARAGDPRLFELGESVARSVEERRAAAQDEIVRALGRHARDLNVDEPREQLEVVRASFLVERKKVGELEREAETLARRHFGRMSLDLVGPMPAHSFVALEQSQGG